jgi:hypothetical protein
VRPTPRYPKGHNQRAAQPRNDFAVSVSKLSIRVSCNIPSSRVPRVAMVVKSRNEVSEDNDRSRSSAVSTLPSAAASASNARITSPPPPPDSPDGVAAMGWGTVRRAMAESTTCEDANPLSRPCSEGAYGLGHAQIP